MVVPPFHTPKWLCLVGKPMLVGTTILGSTHIILKMAEHFKSSELIWNLRETCKWWRISWVFLCSVFFSACNLVKIQFWQPKLVRLPLIYTIGRYYFASQGRLPINKKQTIPLTYLLHPQCTVNIASKRLKDFRLEKPSRRGSLVGESSERTNIFQIGGCITAIYWHACGNLKIQDPKNKPCST